MENSNQNTNKENYLPKLLTPGTFYFLIAIIVFLIIMMLLIFFDFNFSSKGKAPKSNEELVKSIMGILTFCILIVGICIFFLPNLKNLKNFLYQISSVTYVIIFTIFTILFYNLFPDSILNNYSYLINPFIIGLGAFTFYKSSTRNYIGEFSVSYERIKMLILLFCLITLGIIFYNINPGGFTERYFGSSMLLTIIMTVFAFIYLIVIMTVPDESGSNKPNILSNFSSLSVYGSISFLLFLAFMTILISSNKDSFFSNKAKSSSVMILLLLISIIWTIMLSGNLLSGDSNSKPDISLFKKSLLILFGLVISGLFIFWLTQNIQGLTGSSGITSFILNLSIIILVIGLIYKTVYVKMPAGNNKKNAFFNILSSTLFYIPCLVSEGFDWTSKFFVGQYNATNFSSIIMLLISIALIGSYFTMPSIFNKINIQGGKQLVNKPVGTDSEYNLGNYIDLNGSDNLDYQYALSCWVFIDSAPPNTSSSYTKYTSLLNFGNKPNILYNAEKHTLMITMKQKNLKDITKNKLIDFDDDGNRIIYMNDKFLLQKWNNIIINYSGGTFDVFLNGELVKSSIEVVPYYTLDNLTIGENGGIKGGICNVIYFRHALSSPNIYYLYNLIKNRTPPTLNDSNETILVQNIEKTNAATQNVIKN